MTRKTTLPIGTISSGTLRLEDLIPALAGELDRLRLTRAERKTVREALVWDSTSEESTDVDLTNDPNILYDELTQIADAHCPDYCYFGSTEGDGAEIGVWPSIPDHFDDDVYRSSYLPGEDGPVPGYERSKWRHKYADQSYWLHVNDHGNTTLYRRSGRTWREVWSVV